MKIRILSSARRDLLEGREFYEKQGEGVGAYFLDTLMSDIDSLVINAGVHPLVFGEYYRMLSKRFPFAVYYKMENKQPVVYAILDCRRNPAWIRGQLE